MDKILTNSESYEKVIEEHLSDDSVDHLSTLIKECIDKINEIIDWINSQ